MADGSSILRKKRGFMEVKEGLIKNLLFLSALISVLTTLGIILTLARETLAFFETVPLREFLTDTRWAPLYTPQHFGVLPLINGTLMIALGAGFVALPVGLASAIYLSEYASPRTRGTIKPVLEILAGIPTVVYGYFAIHASSVKT